MPTLRYKDGLNTYGGVLDVCGKLEGALHLKMSKPQKLLMIEKGTVEGLLAVLQGRPIKVEVGEAKSRFDKERTTYLKDSLTDEVLITAQTIVDEGNVQPDVMRELKERKLGIGEILGKFRVETRREIREIGYDAFLRRFYRRYDIIAGGKVWFTILESFDRSLYSATPFL